MLGCWSAVEKALPTESSSCLVSDISEDVGDVTANIGIASPTPSPSLKDGGEDAKEVSMAPLMLFRRS